LNGYGLLKHPVPVGVLPGILAGLRLLLAVPEGHPHEGVLLTYLLDISGELCLANLEPDVT